MQALATTNGNVTAAAKKLGISRRTLHRRINEMNVVKTPTGHGSATNAPRVSSSETGS
jgi:DNA-binding NtrC family response regulator